MADWIAETQVCKAYRVGPETLRRHSRRGLLPCRRIGGDTIVYDREFVSRMFRPRGRTISPVSAEHRIDNCGVLGETRLGEVRPARRRSDPLAA